MQNNVVEVKASEVEVREISVITVEIKDLCRQARSMALIYAVEIGRRLHEAKAALPHGSWGEWLKNEVEFSQSSANNFMRLFDEYGSKSNSQLIANLPYAKALELLAVPAEEREAAAVEVAADEKTVKELRAALLERDRAKQNEAAARAREADISGQYEAARRQVLELEKKLAEAAESASEEMAEKLREKLSDELNAEFEERLREATESGRSAEATLEAQKAELEALRRKVKVSDPKVAEVGYLFSEVQRVEAKMREMILNFEDETKEKLKAAVLAFFKRSMGYYV